MIGLSPLPAAHPLRFQPKWVRPSTGSYPCFSLAAGRSPGFASAARDWKSRPVQTRFRCGSPIAWPRRAPQLAGSFYKRHAVTPRTGAPTACGRTVSGAVSLPSRGAFHLSLTVLVHYRSSGSVQPWRAVPPASARVSRARAYSGTCRGGRMRFAYGALTRYRRPSHAVPLRVRFATSREGSTPPLACPATPAGQRVEARRRRRFGLARFRSPLLARSRLISLPRGTWMFRFPRLPRPALCVRAGAPGHGPGRVPPFGDPRIEGRLRLPAAYRSLPRPSSAPDAKASTVRPRHLPVPRNPPKGYLN